MIAKRIEMSQIKLYTKHTPKLLQMILINKVLYSQFHIFL